MYKSRESRFIEIIWGDEQENLKFKLNRQITNTNIRTGHNMSFITTEKKNLELATLVDKHDLAYRHQEDSP